MKISNFLQKIKSFFWQKPEGFTVRPMFPLVLGLITFLGASAVSSQSSYITLVPSTTSVLSGERFSIDVFANANVPVNAVDVTIEYLPEAIEVLSVDKGQSVLTIWTKEPVIENTTISFSGGTFRRGFIGEHLIATIKVEAKHSGNTEFLVKAAELLAGDGKGTPVKVTGTGESSKKTFVIYSQNEDPAKITAEVGIEIKADIDGDGTVTLKDISAFMASWHKKDTNYDFNSDGRMNFIDFSIILAKSFF
jgi:hypothetical protein